MRRLLALSLAFLVAITAPITYPLTAQAQTIQTIGTNSARGYGFNAANNSPVPYPVFSYLVVGGGAGAGGASTSLYSGGGGGGAVVAGSSRFPPATYTITIGPGGMGGTNGVLGPGTIGSNGSPTTFAGSITANGGGGGGPAVSASPGNGANGATGGGGGSTNGTAGVGSQGFAGGNANSTVSAGGGGGAGAVGLAGTSVGGNGGAGVASSISGASVSYGGGGGGAGTGNASGGAGGGGTGGASGGGSTAGTNGTANLGGGGGGSTGGVAVSGNGGSGVVILSVPTGVISYVVTGSPTITTAGGNTIFTYTASGTFAYTMLPSVFLMGSLTRAGHGGCTGTTGLPAGSFGYNNLTYAGTFPLVFSATGTATSADNRYKIDTHNCLVPNGTYGNAPTVAPASGTYDITDNHGWLWHTPISAIAGRWDVANIDTGTNVDTISANQLLNILKTGDPTLGASRTGPAMGDTVYLRCGMVYMPPFLDGAPSATTGIVAPGDVRVQRHNYAAMVTEYTTGNAGGAYTAFNLPAADWVTITDDVKGCATIRHIHFNSAGGASNNQVIQGFRLTNLNFQMNFTGTNGFNTAQALFQIGNGTTSQSYFQIDNNTFLSNSTVVGQRGQQGIWSTNVGNNNGTSGCTAATIAYSDNFGGPPNGSGATAHAVIAGGVITSWVQDTRGSNYDDSVGANGVPPAAGGTWATVTPTGCSTTPTATPVLAGLDILEGINGAGTSGGVGETELYVHDNYFQNMQQAFVPAGNQNNGGVYTTPTNFWFIGNTCDQQWITCFQSVNAAPVYNRWNFSMNIKWASGNFHTDCYQRSVLQMTSGTYPFGDEIGNICVRAAGQATWSDASGIFHAGASGVQTVVFTGCFMEGNVIITTAANGLTLYNCDGTAQSAFNTLIWDPAASIANPNHNGVVGTSNAPLINKYAFSNNFNGLSAYNAVAGTSVVWSGGSPTSTCNVGSIGVGAPTSTYANPPADWTLLNSRQAVQTAIQPKPLGNLTPSAPAQGTCNAGGPALYTAGAGLYFDYVNRVSTAPF